MAHEKNPHPFPRRKGQQNVTSYANRVHLPRTGSELNRQVVSNVPARGVTKDENTIKVNTPGHPLVPAVVTLLPLEPPHGLHPVVHRGRKAVFWGETVVRGHHGGTEARGKTHTARMHVWPRARAKAEAAAVEKHHHGQHVLVVVFVVVIIIVLKFVFVETEVEVEFF